MRFLSFQNFITFLVEQFLQCILHCGLVFRQDSGHSLLISACAYLGARMRLLVIQINAHCMLYD